MKSTDFASRRDFLKRLAAGAGAAAAAALSPRAILGSAPKTYTNPV